MAKQRRYRKKQLHGLAKLGSQDLAGFFTELSLPAKVGVVYLAVGASIGIYRAVKSFSLLPAGAEGYAGPILRDAVASVVTWPYVLYNDWASFSARRAMAAR